MIDFKRGAIYVGVAVALIILLVWLINPWIGEKYNLGTLAFIVLLFAALWVIIKLILVYERKTALTRTEIFVLVIVSTVVALMLFVLFKNNLVPSNFLGAIEGVHS